VSYSAKACLRAFALSLGAMPSSSSTQTISEPDADAIGNMLGFSPGVKINERRGWIILPVFVLVPEIVIL
jgi:hypothetical protein